MSSRQRQVFPRNIAGRLPIQWLLAVGILIVGLWFGYSFIEDLPERHESGTWSGFQQYIASSRQSNWYKERTDSKAITSFLCTITREQFNLMAGHSGMRFGMLTEEQQRLIKEFAGRDYVYGNMSLDTGRIVLIFSSDRRQLEWYMPNGGKESCYVVGLY